MSYEPLFGLTWALQDKDEAKILETIESLYMSGVDLKAFVDGYLDFALNLTKFALFKNIKVTDIHVPNNVAWLNRLTDTLLELKNTIRYDNSYKPTIEATLLKFCRG